MSSIVLLLPLLLLLLAAAAPAALAVPSPHVRPRALTRAQVAAVLSPELHAPGAAAASVGAAAVEEHARALWADVAALAVDRRVGSAAHRRTGERLAAWFGATAARRAAWAVEVDEWTAATPLGNRTFRNVVARWQPPETRPNSGGGGGGDGSSGGGDPRPAVRRRQYVVAAHYDSKVFDFPFAAATDSAVPCALMLDAARRLDALGAWDTPRRVDPGMLASSPPPGSVNSANRRANAHTGEVPVTGVDDLPGLTLVFLDGEEAFVEWTEKDSIYGARRLADRWSRPRSRDGAVLPRVDAFVLLDLLGGPDAKIPSFHEPTQWLHDHLRDVEERAEDVAARRLGVDGAGAFRDATILRPEKQYQVGAGLQDDHVPFLRRGVPVLHLIAVPFPATWHTKDDDVAHLDRAGVEHWHRTLPVWLAELLHLEVHDANAEAVPPPPPAPRDEL